MAGDIVKLISRHVSAIILVFWTQAPLANSKGNPNRALHAGWENLRFLIEIAVYLGNGRPPILVRYAHGYNGKLIGSRRWRTGLRWFRWPWITLKGRTRGVKYFTWICLITFHLTQNDQIRKDNTRGKGVFLGGQPCHCRKGEGSQHSQFLGFLSVYAFTIYCRTTKFDVVIWRVGYLRVSHAFHPNIAEFQRSTL